MDSAQTKNVIEATNKPNLFEKLEDLQKRFVSCDFYSAVQSARLCVHCFENCLSTGWDCVKRLLLNIWRLRDLPFHDSTLFHLQTCWTSSPKGIVPERWILKHFFSLLFFSFLIWSLLFILYIKNVCLICR